MASQIEEVTKTDATDRKPDTAAKAETLFFSTEGGRIAYDVRGSGPLVVCVPSMGDVRAEYRFLVPQLVAEGYRIATMDVRGHGESSTGWSDYSVAGVGRDIIALIRHLGGPAAVIGTSMAAGAAVYAAAEAPDLFLGLVIVGPFVHDIPGPGWMRYLLKALFARPWGPASWERYYKSLYPTRKPADFAEYTAALKANLKEPGRLGALQKMLAASKRASGERLGRVKAPVLVVMGSRDPDFKDPVAEANYLGEQLHGTVRMLEGAGHYPHAEMPEQFLPAVAPFLGEVAPRRNGGSA